MITISGPDFEAMARKLEAAGRSLDREIGRTVDDELGTLPEAVQASALRILPHRGGLAALVASKVKVQKRRGSNSINVFSTGVAGLKELRRLDAGSVRHPVFGNRGAWVGQAVNAKFWTRPVKERGDAIYKALKELLTKIADGI